MRDGGDHDALLQRRVARFGAFVGGIVLAGLAIRATAHLLLGNTWASFVSIAWFGHLAAGGVLVALGFALGRAPRSRRAVERWETAAVWAAAVAFQLVGIQLDVEARPDYVILLSLMVVFVGRAAFVPSSPVRTAWSTGLVGLPMVALIHWDLASRVGDPTIPDHAYWTRTLNVGVWWAIVTALCVSISQTIYGLRAEVRQARRLGQYQLEELLAVGGMGEVYRARHAMLRRPTAVKLIRPERVGARTAARFEREAKRTAGLSHPHTVTVYDYGRTDDGVFYYAMELLEGADLQAIVDATGPMPPARAATLLAQIAGALWEAHRAGLVHRDIKPSNVLVVERGGEGDFVKVVDFGLVKDVDAQDTAASHAGQIVGTPLYLSPEAITTPSLADERSDLYALGALGVFLLTGEPPFLGETPLAVYQAHLEAAPPSIAERRGEPVDAALERLLSQCLAKDPERRPQTAHEVEIRLRDALERLPPWDSYDARSWWDRHGDEVRAHRERPGAASGGAMTVAFGERGRDAGRERSAPEEPSA